jgi:hypothetical protein
MNTQLLNALIEADILAATQPSSETLEVCAQHVLAWKLSVESLVAQLPRPLSDANKAALKQLIQKSEAMIDGFTHFKQTLYVEQQKLTKNNTALSAYMSATG